MLRTISWPLRLVLAVAAVMMVAPDLETNLWAAAVAAPILLLQIISWKKTEPV